MPLSYFQRYRMEARPAVVAADPALPAGYRFVAWDAARLEEHAEAKHESFRDEVDARVFDCLGQRDGCRRLLEKISTKPGFLAQATWLIEYVAGPADAPHKREPCGTIQGSVVTPRMGAIHNLGVTPLHRGRGLGRALVAMAMQGFLQAGVPRVYLEVTTENTAAVRLYQRLGFQRVRTTYKAVETPLDAAGKPSRVPLSSSRFA